MHNYFSSCISSIQRCINKISVLFICWKLDDNRKVPIELLTLLNQHYWPQVLPISLFSLLFKHWKDKEKVFWFCNSQSGYSLNLRPRNLWAKSLVSTQMVFKVRLKKTKYEVVYQTCLWSCPLIDWNIGQYSNLQALSILQEQFAHVCLSKNTWTHWQYIGPVLWRGLWIFPYLRKKYKEPASFNFLLMLCYWVFRYKVLLILWHSHSIYTRNWLKQLRRTKPLFF